MRSIYKTKMEKEEEILQRLVLGERGAVLKGIYEACFPKIKSMLIRLKAKEQQDIEDIFQEGLLSFIITVKKPTFELKGSYYGLLKTICKMLWFKKCQQKGRGQQIALENSDLSTLPLIEQAIIEQEIHEFYRDKFDQLNEKCQQLLNLYYENHSMREIAKRMNYKSEGVAKISKHRCKSKLISLIKSDPRFYSLSNLS